MKQSEEKVPEQQEGASSDITHVVEAKSDAEAAQLYEKARTNLLNINHWQRLAGKLSAAFLLTDASGNAVQREPQKGDYIRIHLPTSAEDKFDWVRIEKIEEEHENATQSHMLIQVRPSDPPHPAEETEHFFSETATSSFFVERLGLKVSAMVRGRNELPNLEAEGVIDKLRNAAIAVGAMLGLNSPQWKALAKGILED